MLVLLVDVEGDPHTSSVASALDRMCIANLRISIEDVGHRRFTVTQTGLMWNGILVPAGTTIFWRYPGRYGAPSDMSEPESQMLTAELAALFTGALFASRPRWVHHPHQVLTAANKILQLTTAKELGANTPDWLVTNSAADAMSFIEAGPTLAKPVSSGPGLNPYASVISPKDADRLHVAPTMLQHVVDAEFDVRLVTVGFNVFAWRRLRVPGQRVDWRESDPAGRDFRRSSTPSWHELAVAISSALGLRVTVQDWLVDRRGQPTFLEVNTRGAWLFLEDCRRRVKTDPVSPPEN